MRIFGLHFICFKIPPYLGTRQRSALTLDFLHNFSVPLFVCLHSHGFLACSLFCGNNEIFEEIICKWFCIRL